MNTWLFYFISLKLCPPIQNYVENIDYYLRTYINIIWVMGLNYLDICHIILFLCKSGQNARSNTLVKAQDSSTQWIAMEVFFIDCLMCNNNWYLFHTLQKIILGSVCNLLSIAILFNRRGENLPNTAFTNAQNMPLWLVYCLD